MYENPKLSTRLCSIKMTKHIIVHRNFSECFLRQQPIKKNKSKLYIIQNFMQHLTWLINALTLYYSSPSNFVLFEKASKKRVTHKNIIVFFYSGLVQRKQKQIHIQFCKYKQIDRDKFLDNCGDAGEQWIRSKLTQLRHI